MGAFLYRTENVAFSRGFKPCINLGWPQYVNARNSLSKATKPPARFRRTESLVIQALQTNTRNLNQIGKAALYLKRSKQKMNVFV
jgi:hypothetical protein